MSDEKRLIKMTVLPSITVDTGYEGEEGQTFEEYSIKGFLLLRNTYNGSEDTPDVSNPGRVIDDRKILVNIWVYAYKYDENSGETIDDVVLRRIKFVWDVDKRILEPEKLLAYMVVDFLCDEICCKTFDYGQVFGSVGTFKSNVEFCFTNNLEMNTDYFNFLRFCHCFKKDFGKDDEEQHANVKQSVRRYRIG